MSQNAYRVAGNRGLCIVEEPDPVRQDGVLLADYLHISADGKQQVEMQRLD